MKLAISKSASPRASVLIIVMWVAFGLVAITLYFADSMFMEMKAADNRVASLEADQAIEGAALYVSNVLATRSNLSMSMLSVPAPDEVNFHANAVKVGDATFWLVGRDTNDLQTSPQGDEPVWGLIDEASKLNINSAGTNTQVLPNMTLNTIAAMYDWTTSSNSQPSQNGAKSETYSSLQPPYLCKNGPYETVDELRMVYGMNMDILFGEDGNLNDHLDPNENDGNVLPPMDNSDGVLDPGALEYVTVWTHEPTTMTNGVARIAVTNTTALQGFIQTNYPSLESYLTVFGISGTSGTGTGTRGGTTGGPGNTGGGVAAAAAAPNSVLDFYVRSGMSETEFQQIEPFLMNTNVTGLININTATATTLASIPGIGSNYAQQVLTYRQSNPPLVPSITWLKNVLPSTSTATIAQIGPYITPYSFQFTADVVAVGHHNRGYRRVRFVFDCSTGTPLIVYRKDLTYLGWALGKKLHDKLLAGN
ncbi:MAG: helix-hairpin-helix domain-containing protein [Limisphaerales bacterium]